MSVIFDTFIFLASFIFVLGFLVFFHELGHYSVARLFGVSVERFSVGFGKPIAEWTLKSGEIWSIGRLPLGGYVKFLGDAGGASNPDHEALNEMKAELEAGGRDASSCFHFKPLWQRVCVVLAGPLANFILAILITAGLALSFGTVSFKSVVMTVETGGAAEQSGVLTGDMFLSLDGNDVREYRDLVTYISLHSDTELTAIVDRDGSEITFPITPKRKERKDFIGGTNAVGTIGIGLSNSREHIVRKSHGPISALSVGVNDLASTIKSTGTYIGRIFTGKEDGKALGGVARIATMTGKTAVDISKQEISMGEKARNMLYGLLSLAAALSIGLGVANLMPIPALDGGHLLYYSYEAIAGRPLSEQKQEFGFRIGFAVLIGLMIVLTINDVGYIRSLFT
ncbi:MAG: M50 family metallopeptidase [Maricaulaceae bacterium]